MRGIRDESKPSVPPTADSSISASCVFCCDFFLFYLTGKTIFDNRHGLLKKFDCGRAAKTLSALDPQ
jgi:hypothetical protein